MVKCFLDRHDYHRRWLLTVDGEASFEVRVHGNPRASVHANRLVRAGYKEDQPDPRVLNEIFQTIDFVVATPVGYQQRTTIIHNVHEAGPIAFGRAVET